MSHITVKECSGDCKKDVHYRCGFCGTSLEEKYVNIKCGDNTLTLRASDKAVENMKKAQSTGLWYWINICPACSSFVGVQIIETDW